tara:strand:- start:37 stop:324 length:288 start_codon:yes stop_codon:yes gene_type:complete
MSDKIPDNAPEQVKDVARAWLKNAEEGGEESSGRMYVEEDGGMWTVADNLESGVTILKYCVESGDWFSMRPYGDERRMRGGFKEALATAQIIWTG